MNKYRVKEAKQYLCDPQLTERIAADMEALGYVGEKENKILGYLISISRKLTQPLSGIVVSSPSSGKSKLIDTLEQLTPTEDVVFASRLTTQALFYIQKGFLKHKLLIIEERAGSESADYAIRSLQSKGRLSLAIPIKNQTVFFEVQGPVSILETTAGNNLNPENSSRCFILQLDESKEQTERIHTFQRFSKTEEAVLLKDKAEGVISLHRDIQGVLKAHPVIIPYARELSFPAHSPLLRREHQKFLTLIESTALLYQYQRKILTKNGVQFILSTADDYRIASGIYRNSYKKHLLMVHPKAGLLFEMLSSINKSTFSRRDIAEFTGWPKYKVRDNILSLETAGLLQIIRKAKGIDTLYSLNTRLELKEPEEIASSTT